MCCMSIYLIILGLINDVFNYFDYTASNDMELSAGKDVA
jgi:hypothetical protein